MVHPPKRPKEPYQIVCDGKAITIYPLIFNRKYNNPAAYLVLMEPPPTPKPTISNPPTSDATGQSRQFLGVLYLALRGLIYSALPEARPWAVAGKALFYLVKLGPIIWWAMPVPSLTPPSPYRASRYSWYPDKNSNKLFCKTENLYLDQCHICQPLFILWLAIHLQQYVFPWQV
ncbi:hypothetical protein DSO57_1016881 [Entomophthora muscae]|uniref:Uncharacterized protein n=1 Tax=Entomophthora muscae TaxID=34485 RepID=A0ACC2TSD7_9FUNG|nr:hypothetical protein DSO57_1016881 [Entomophthora muscae]